MLKSNQITLFFVCYFKGLRSVLERLVLKKYAECTSQRLKRTSGARVMIATFGRQYPTFLSFRII